MISDTHGYHEQLEVPDGDVLVHAGDCLRRGTLEELVELDEWLGALPHAHKVLIAGNHDWCFEQEPERARELVTNAQYLQDEATEIAGVRFWGSPWQPRFMDWAFNLDRGEPLAEKWAMIPDDTDVLVTHGPPHGIRDLAYERNCGCEELLLRVREVQPRVHVFGHIHECPGVEQQGATIFVNAATGFGRGQAFVVDL